MRVTVVAGGSWTCTGRVRAADTDDVDAVAVYVVDAGNIEMAGNAGMAAAVEAVGSLMGNCVNVVVVER